MVKSCDYWTVTAPCCHRMYRYWIYIWLVCLVIISNSLLTVRDSHIRSGRDRVGGCLPGWRYSRWTSWMVVQLAGGLDIDCWWPLIRQYQASFIKQITLQSKLEALEHILMEPARDQGILWGVMSNLVMQSQGSSQRSIRHHQSLACSYYCVDMNTQYICIVYYTNMPKIHSMYDNIIQGHWEKVFTSFIWASWVWNYL